MSDSASPTGSPHGDGLVLKSPVGAPASPEIESAGRDSVEVIAALPNELLLHIFCFLELTELGRAAAVCRRWHEVLASTDLPWEAVLNRAFVLPDRQDLGEFVDKTGSRLGRERSLRWSDVIDVPNSTELANLRSTFCAARRVTHLDVAEVNEAASSAEEVIRGGACGDAEESFIRESSKREHKRICRALVEHAAVLRDVGSVGDKRSLTGTCRHDIAEGDTVRLGEYQHPELGNLRGYNCRVVAQRPKIDAYVVEMFIGGRRVRVTVSRLDVRRLVCAGSEKSCTHHFACDVHQVCKVLQDVALRNFVLGLWRGFIPSDQGDFAYAAFSATPIHYRYSAERATWEWSMNDKTWQPTTTTRIPLDAFPNAHRCRLVEDNIRIVKLLEAFPVPPLFRVTAAGRSALPPLFSAKPFDLAQLERARALIPTRMSAIENRQFAIPCMARRTVALHFPFTPPILVQVVKAGGVETNQFCLVDRARAIARPSHVNELETYLKCVPGQNVYGIRCDFFRLAQLWKFTMPGERPPKIDIQAL